MSQPVKMCIRDRARHDQSRDCLLLLEAILETPGLMPRLLEVLRPGVLNESADPEKADAPESAKSVGKRRKVVER